MNIDQDIREKVDKAFFKDSYYGSLWEEKRDIVCEFIQEERNNQKEWICEKCLIVYPGPPSKGFDCVLCKKCDGYTMPRPRYELEKEKAKSQRYREALEKIAHDDHAEDGGCEHGHPDTAEEALKAGEE